MPAEGFKGHVATDGSPLGTAGMWGACCWSVAHLDYDEGLGPLHGMYGSMESACEVQRTIKSAELTAFLCLLKKVIGPTKVYVGNKGLLMGCGEEQGNALIRKLVMQTCGSTSGKSCICDCRKILVDVEHVKAHRTRRIRKRCHNLRSLSLRAVRERMSWQRQEQCWTMDLWRK